MSLVCRTSAPKSASATDTNLPSCPWCRTVSSGELGARMQCQTCKRDFTRVEAEPDDVEELASGELGARAPCQTCRRDFTRVEAEADDVEELPRTWPVPTPGYIRKVHFDKPTLSAAAKRKRSEDDEDEACGECQQPKRPKQEKSRKRKEPESDSESDEEDVRGLARVILLQKRTRLSGTAEADVFKAFETLSTQQSASAETMRDHEALTDKQVKLHELKAFSLNFKLSTPVPTDFIGIMAKDPAKQWQIQQTALRNAEAAALKKRQSKSLEAARAENHNSMFLDDGGAFFSANNDSGISFNNTFYSGITEDEWFNDYSDEYDQLLEPEPSGAKD
jgi:hypothetical protein